MERARGRMTKIESEKASEQQRKRETPRMRTENSYGEEAWGYTVSFSSISSPSVFYFLSVGCSLTNTHTHTHITNMSMNCSSCWVLTTGMPWLQLDYTSGMKHTNTHMCTHTNSTEPALQVLVFSPITGHLKNTWRLLQFPLLFSQPSIYTTYVDVFKCSL